MPKLILLVGPPGSGKSTLAKKYESEGFVRISQDDQGKDGHREAFSNAGREGKNIVVDRMNFNVQQRQDYLNHGKIHGYETEILVIHENHETCLQRALNRIQNEGHPTIKDEKNARAALQTFFTKYERPKEGEADKLTFVYPEGDKPRVIVCDLDGTLCNVEHRRHYVRRAEGEKKDWAGFNREIINDTLNTWCLDIISRFSSNTVAERYRIPTIFCSGRNENERKTTITWLDKYVDFPYKLYMRHRVDSRQDAIIKEIILDFELLTRYAPYFMIDDRTQVVEMWRKRGFVTLQCDEGDF